MKNFIVVMSRGQDSKGLCLLGDSMELQAGFLSCSRLDVPILRELACAQLWVALGGMVVQVALLWTGLGAGAGGGASMGNVVDRLLKESSGVTLRAAPSCWVLMSLPMVLD